MRSLVLLVAVAGMVASGVATRAADLVTAGEKCVSAGLSVGRDTSVVEIYRVYTAADGKSYGETIKLQGSRTTYLGAVLTQFGLGDPSNVVIVHGPAYFEIPMHAAPYPEIFLVLSGSSTINLSSGQRHELGPGSLVLFEDTTGAGHGGKVGACGYVALDLQFKGPTPLAAPPVRAPILASP